MTEKRIMAEKKMVALTFDDGPDSTYDEQILEILNRYNLKATFFMVGINVIAYTEVARLIDGEGHAIGCHSYNHPNMASMTKEAAFKEQIERNQAIFGSVLGKKPAFFRPPYGAITNEQIRYFSEKGIITVFWTVDAGDWDTENSTPNSIKKKVIENVHENAIVLMHSGRTSTLKALPEIVEALQHRCFHFCTIPRLLNISESMVDQLSGERRIS
jgi:peptidoglycan/xylan/chitin deacetylase (PgdA/CDA1 family)